MYANRTIIVPSAHYCERWWIDLDAPAIGHVEAADPDSPSADVLYDGCKQGISVADGSDIALGYGPTGTLTEEECSQAAHSQPLGHPEPITNIREGTVLCAVTNLHAVAWVRVTLLDEYFDDGGTSAPKPKLHLLATLWK